MKKTIDIDYKIEWSYGVTLSKIKKDVEELEKLGATHLNIENYGYIEYNPICEREETKEEEEKRIEQKRIYEEEQRERELYLLKQLKLKYEK